MKNDPFERDDCVIKANKTGKMNIEIMKIFYDKIIVPYLDSKGIDKCLLICDGYKSHNHKDVVEYMKRVELLVLPSSSTSLLQPLDVNCFKPLKDELRMEWEIYYLEREDEQQPNLTERRERAVDAFLNKYRTVDRTTIIKAFQMCGIKRENEQLFAPYNRKLQELVNMGVN